jgi:hypothetical protein
MCLARIMLEHDLSDETLMLLEQAVAALDGRLAIYAPHNWAVEHIQGSGRLAFDPYDDNHQLRTELRRIIARGGF